MRNIFISHTAESVAAELIAGLAEGTVVLEREQPAVEIFEESIAKRSDKECFVILPHSDPNSTERNRAQDIMEQIIRPSLLNCGYKAVRAEDISKPGIIAAEIIQRIIDAPIVIADLTGMNPNIFYELGIRHAIRKPFVQLVQKGENLPFDLTFSKVIAFDPFDLDSIEETKRAIENEIRSLENKKPEEIESPVSGSLALKSLQVSSRTQDQTLYYVMHMLADFRSEMVHSSRGLNIFSLEGTIAQKAVLSIREKIVREAMQEYSAIISERLRIADKEAENIVTQLKSKQQQLLEQKISEYDKLIDELAKRLGATKPPEGSSGNPATSGQK